mmetsp:Transcript_4619/g.8067  ORF Transcript_4619/g.8067 Transcript_4619/m.8067 type:complete len:269 (-) Transcript_4619:156-962(-)
MLIKEYRLLLPLTAKEYHIAQLYMVAKASAEETGKQQGEGIQIIHNHPYTDNEHGLPPGQYTEKIMYFKTRVPSFISMLMPESALQLTERSWNAFPKSLTIYHNEWLGDRFHLSVETMHSDDRGTQANANQLHQSELDVRKVDYINISCDDVNVKFSEENDPRAYVSKKTGRGPFDERWFEKSAVCSCAYKVVRLRFRMWGVQTKVETWGHQYGLRGAFVEYHRKLVCWMDEWFDLGIEDIRKMESDIRDLNAKRLKATEGFGSATQP